MLQSIYDSEVQTIDMEPLILRCFQGSVLLIVNVASQCGFTKQYHGLQRLYDRYQAEGFKVLGFPCNQFASQEPGSRADIKQFCQDRFTVTFPLFDKIDVRGEQAHPLFQYLISQQVGIMGTKSIKWNFTKFLCDRSGKVIKRYSPRVKPASIEADIRQCL